MSKIMNKLDDIQVINNKEELLSSKLIDEDLYVQNNGKIYIVTLHDDFVIVEDENFNEYILSDLDKFTAAIFDKKTVDCLLKLSTEKTHVSLNNTVIPAVFEFQIELLDGDSNTFQNVIATNEKNAKKIITENCKDITFGRVENLSSVPF